MTTLAERSPITFRAAGSFFRRYYPGLALILAAAVLYLLTLQDALLPHQLQGGDLITHQYAQAQGRFSNAPGYPLYTMGGWLWFHLGRLLLGQAHNPVSILSSYSTLWALVALWLLYLLILEVTDRGPGGNQAVAVLAGAFYAVTYFFWYYAVTTEQYTSAVAWTLAVFWLAFRWDRTRQDRYLLWIAFLAGVALAHMLTLPLAIPPLLVFVLAREPKLLRRPRLIAAALGLAALPLLSYAYVYVRGAQHPEWRGAGQWASNWQWFLSFISTSQGRSELTWSWSPFLTAEFPSLIWRELTWPGLIAGVIGLASLGQGRALAVYASLGIYLAFCWVDRLGNWFQVIMPAYALLVVGLALAGDSAWRWGSRGGGLQPVGGGAGRIWNTNNAKVTEHAKREEREGWPGLSPFLRVLRAHLRCPPLRRRLGAGAAQAPRPPAPAVGQASPRFGLFMVQTPAVRKNLNAAPGLQAAPPILPVMAASVQADTPTPPARAQRSLAPRLLRAAVGSALAALVVYRGLASYPQAHMRARPEANGLAPGWAILADDPPQGAAVLATLPEDLALDYLTEVWGLRPDLRTVTAPQARALLEQARTPLVVTTGFLPLVPREVSAQAHYSALGRTLAAVRTSPGTALPAGLWPWHEAFGAGLRLAGGNVRRNLATGETVALLAWQAQAAPARDLSVSVRFLRGGNEIAQVDHRTPVAGAYPTSVWSPGEVVLDAYPCRLPPGLPPDAITVILYYQDAGGAYTNVHVAHFTVPPN